ISSMEKELDDEINNVLSKIKEVKNQGLDIKDIDSELLKNKIEYLSTLMERSIEVFEKNEKLRENAIQLILEIANEIESCNIIIDGIRLMKKEEEKVVDKLDDIKSRLNDINKNTTKALMLYSQIYYELPLYIKDKKVLEKLEDIYQEVLDEYKGQVPKIDSET
ncbi:MAG: hypothetical protein N3G76_02605, partial [Candidatus Micrarchaeota archaeon]|nr:hypothetical protein [Candidatus Micrarchaeota archaeon]